MEDSSRDYLHCRFVVHELLSDEYQKLSELLDCKVGGCNPSTMKQYISKEISNPEDWRIISDFLVKYSHYSEKSSLSYMVGSELSWGSFEVPEKSVKFCNEFECRLKVSYFTNEEKL